MFGGLEIHSSTWQEGGEGKGVGGGWRGCEEKSEILGKNPQPTDLTE